MSKKKISFYIFFILVLFLYMLTFSGIFYPKKYCIDNFCIERPSMYYFQTYLGENKVQTALCSLSFDCQNQFSFNDNFLNTLMFKNIFENKLTLIISSIEDKYHFQYLKITKPYYKCKISESNISDIKDAYSTHGYFRDSNITFALYADDKEIFDKTLDDLCKY